MNMKHLLLTAAMIAAGLTFSTAQADTVTATMDVRIQILDACEINVTPTLMDFGPHGVLSADIAATSDFEVTCTTGAAYSIGLDGGASTDITARTMTDGTDFVEYQLYQEVGHTNVWGNTPNTDTVDGTGIGTEQLYTAFGLVVAQATPPAGVYTDQVTVTVTY